ncbi:glycosyltransferase family 8 protein [Acinetobacter faecalis]|uniref:Glycosyltransferase n=1 Tax=Acinetobacter faecalis TaxID=2665161 RepID=A0ABU5GGT8_9GAMM|nr:glycosyltransferase [Acinetobacter faecalis]MDY6549760.1 glycosyltransferase [Acinetobacter faecalis]
MNKFLIKEVDLVKKSTKNGNIDINVALAIDENYITPSGVLLFSILENNKDLNIHFHIFTTCCELDKFINFKKFQSNITIYLLNEDYFSSLQTPGHFTSAIYYRIAIPSILQNRVKNVLYIDADVLCIGSLEEFNKIDISDYYIAAVEDLGMIREDIVALGISGKYFNSGVMFMNVEKWVSENIFEKFMVLVNDRIFEYPDQDALNILLNNKVLYVSNCFNHFKELNSEQAKLIHYVGWLKPWSMAAENNDKYLRYYRMSPFSEIPLHRPNTYKLAKMLAKKYRKNKRYRDYIKWYCLYLVMKIKHKIK